MTAALTVMTGMCVCVAHLADFPEHCEQFHMGPIFCNKKSLGTEPLIFNFASINGMHFLCCVHDV